MVPLMLEYGLGAYFTNVIAGLIQETSGNMVLDLSAKINTMIPNKTL